MRPRDIFMVCVAMASMLLGSFTPFLAEPLAFLPRLLLMLMLFLGFLAVGTDALWVVLRDAPLQMLRLNIARLFVMPVLAFMVFYVIMPEFALGALVLAAAPVGVMAGVFSLMVRADTAMILVANITTSLMLPFSLPGLLWAMRKVTDALVPGMLELPANLSLGGMAVSLCITILVPFFLAFFIRSRLPRLAAGIMRKQYPISIFAIFFSNLAIFSQYSTILHQSPVLILQALVGSWIVCIGMTLAALPVARKKEPKTGVAYVISYGIVNNILIMILSMEFFSANEALLAAAYLVPCYVMLLYYRHYAKKRGITDDTAQ